MSLIDLDTNKVVGASYAPIKYRIWDTLKKRYVKQAWIDQTGRVFTRHTSKNTEPNRFIVEFSVGHNDEGTEFYVNDIVQDEAGNFFVIKFKDNNFCYEDDMVVYLDLFDLVDDINIIGNVHTDIKLLNGDD